MTETTYAKGLAGVIAAESRICSIDGEVGDLRYRGYSIQDLAENSTFAESAYLLLYGSLPTQTELDAFAAQLNGYRAAPGFVIDALRALPKDTHPMIALQAAIAAHGAHESVPAGNNEDNFERAKQLIARLPTIVAAWQRIADGNEPLAPREDLGHGQNFLYMLTGEAPDAETGHIFDVCLILHMEHSFNASTFTGRVVSATEAPIDASVSAAVGALYGPLHGGANERVLHMLDKIPSAADAPAWLADALSKKVKIMGMGHRVYRAKDPRAFVLEGFLRPIAKKTGGSENLEKLLVIEAEMRRIMEEKGKPIYPNVDYFSGSLYQMLKIPTELFTPIFAVARVVGWTAHILEQWEDNRLYRPRALYTGDVTNTWVDFDKR
ncbi:MAG: citrate synthase [Bradymonadia bacterium]|jgi:citrate synthase